MELLKGEHEVSAPDAEVEEGDPKDAPEELNPASDNPHAGELARLNDDDTKELSRSVILLQLLTVIQQGLS